MQYNIRIKIVTVILVMDCCSAEGYASTYTALLKKLCGNNELVVIILIIIGVVTFYLMTRITMKRNATGDVQDKKDN